MAKKTTTRDLIKSIEKRGIIEEREILLLKKRANAGDKEAARWCPENIRVTDEQARKGFNWLYNLYKTPRGIERRNNPFGYREMDILDEWNEAEGFRFCGWYDDGRFGYHAYTPIYETGGMEYYVWGGKIRIIG